MHIGQPKNGLPRTPNFERITSKVVLGVFFITFFLFNPLSFVLAEETEAQRHKTLLSDLPFKFQTLFPGYISQHFSKWHNAVDIATGLGMPIKPITGGTVTSATFDWFGYGLKVEIDHGNGYKSLYAHMGKIYVKEGQEIDENSYIGEVGLTGRTTGPHTHLEVQKDNQYIDPETLLPQIREYATEEDFKPVGGKGLSGSKHENPIPTPTPKPDVPEWVLKPAVKKPEGEIKKINTLDEVLNLTTPKPVKSNQLDFTKELKFSL